MFMDQKNTTKYSRVFLLIIIAFNGLSGLAGGTGLITDPSAEALGMTTTWLEGTPFKNYLIPGIILFLFNGVGNITVFILGLTEKPFFGKSATAFGLIMMIWIITQVIMIGYQSFLQPLYFSTGLIQLIVGINAWKNSFSNPNKPSKQPA